MRLYRTALPLLLALAAAAAAAQDRRPADEPAVVPEVDRREVPLPKFPSRDFEASAFVGTYASENFGASAVAGLRLGYHLTEDFFVEGAYAATKVSDESFRQVLPGGVFPSETEKLTYYNLSVGYNALPGEVFFGSRQARATAFYVIGGVGSTKFFEQSLQTLNLGFGLKLLLGDRFAVRLDVRDHLYSLDLLGKRQSTQNLEITTGLSLHF